MGNNENTLHFALCKCGAPSSRSNCRRWMTKIHQRLDIKPDALTPFPVLPLLNAHVPLIYVRSPTCFLSSLPQFLIIINDYIKPAGCRFWRKNIRLVISSLLLLSFLFLKNISSLLELKDGMPMMRWKGDNNIKWAEIRHTQK